MFTDVSQLKAGDSVRAAGVRVGTVTKLSLQPDHTVLVAFDADRRVVLTGGSRAPFVTSIWSVTATSN